MRWLVTAGSDQERVLRFLAEQHAAVPGDRIRRYGFPSRRLKRHRFLVYSVEGEIHSLVYQGHGGFFYPLRLTELSETAVRSLRKTIGTFPRAYSVMGLAGDAARFGSIVRRSPTHTVDYHFMRYQGTPESDGVHVPQPFRGLSWRRVGAESAGQLLPLHVAYEREEVLLPGREVNLAVSRSTLIDGLENQHVLVAEYQGEIVARVATNARGIGCDQIGGVYVDPRFRKRGIATWLMAILIGGIRSENKEITLFVKPANRAAVELYNGLDFVTEAPFTINYYW